MAGMHGSSLAARWTVLLPLLCAPALCVAQDLEPRRWTHLPVDTDVAGVLYVFTTGDLGFDPVLRIQDADVDLHTLVLTYTGYFEFLERTARIDVLVPFQTGRWRGLVDGVQTTVRRDGLADPALRLSTNLVGAPALHGKEFLEYRRAHPAQTTLGAALEVRLPLGEYMEDKLINLGQNRFALGAQLGALHTEGEWSLELTGTAIAYTDNDEFFGGNELEQDPLFAVQTHVVKTFGPEFWCSMGVAYGWAGESSVNGVAKDDDKSNLLYGVSAGYRLAETQSLRIGWFRGDTRTDVGADTHNFLLSWAIRF